MPRADLKARAALGHASPEPLRRPGFTLLEVVVALTVGAMLLVGARTMFSAIADGADAIGREAEAHDREANADRLLRSLLRQIETSTDGAEFGGDRHSLRFTSWCTVPAGWQERCRVTVSVTDIPVAPALLATLSTGGSLELHHGFSSAEFRYIGDAARGGTWFEVWGDGIALPVVLAVLVERDTLIDTLLMRIGAR